MTETLELPLQGLIVFLSYSHEDRAVAKLIHDFVTMRGGRVWMDCRSVCVGEDMLDALKKGLQASDALLALGTETSVKSYWVGWECGAAWAIRKPIFPILFGVQWNALPDPLGRLAWCSLESLEGDLLPPLLDLAKKKKVEWVADTEVTQELDKAVGAAAQERIAAEVRQLLILALSGDKGKRRHAHTRLRRMPDHSRQGVSRVLDVLARSPNDHIRGEAYYCLGEIPVGKGTYYHDQQFFAEGLSDPSDKVKSCCVNVMRNFVPLSNDVVVRLRELAASDLGGESLSSHRAGIVYWAHVALDHNNRIQTESSH